MRRRTSGAGQQAAPFAGGLVAQALGVGHAGQQHAGHQQQDRGGGVEAGQGGEAVGEAQQADLQQGGQGGEQAAVAQSLHGLEARGRRRRGWRPGDRGHRGLRGRAGRRRRAGCGRSWAAAAPPRAPAPARRRSAGRRGGGGQQVGRLLQLGGRGQGAEAAPPALPVKGRFALLPAGRDGAPDRALAQPEGRGEFGDRGRAEAHQLGDDAVARALVVPRVGMHRNQEVVVDRPVAIVVDRQARIDRDRFRREDFQGGLAGGQPERRPGGTIGRRGGGRNQGHTHGIAESERKVKGWGVPAAGGAPDRRGAPGHKQNDNTIHYKREHTRDFGFELRKSKLIHTNIIYITNKEQIYAVSSCRPST